MPALADIYLARSNSA